MNTRLPSVFDALILLLFFAVRCTFCFVFSFVCGIWIRGGKKFGGEFLGVGGPVSFYAEPPILLLGLSFQQGGGGLDVRTHHTYIVIVILRG